MWALGSAIILLTAAAGFGQGAGPLAVGMLNDALKNDFGAQTVLLSAAVTAAVGALLLIWAAGSVRAIFSGRTGSISAPRAPPLCFYYCFLPKPTSPRPDSLSVKRSVCDLHHE